MIKAKQGILPAKVLQALLNLFHSICASKEQMSWSLVAFYSAATFVQRE